MYGYKPEELIGKHLKETTPKIEMPKALKVLKIALSGKIVKNFEIDQRDKDGNIFHMEINGTPVTKDGSVVSVQGVMRDITERKHAEEMLQKAHQELEKRVEERSVELSKTNMLLRQEITERKHMEEVLQDSEKKYRELINGMKDTAWVIDFEGNFIDVNDAAVEVLGYSREELLAMGPNDIDSSLDDKKIANLIKGMPTDKLQVFETMHTTKDGKTIPVEIKSSLVTYQGQQAILSIARDITDRKQAEEALRESEERFRKVVETMEVGLGTIDENGVFNYVNKYFSKMLGYPINDMIGRSTFEFFYDETQRQAQKEVLAKRRAGMRDPTPYDLTWRRKDGQKVYTILSPTPMFDADGHYTGSFAIITDITERKRMEEASRESEEKFRTFMETASDLMHISDKDLNFTYVNDAMARTLGYSKEEMIGMNLAQIVKKEVVQKDLKRNLEVLKKQGEMSFESVRVTKDGKEIYGELKTVAIFDKDGAFAGTRGVFRDITERKQAEALIQVRMRLMEFAATHSLKELLQRTVDEVCEFTDSAVGFYHFVEADQKTLSLQTWSTRTIKEFCAAEAEGMHYSIDEAGVWLDCIRERRPVIHNDYASLPHRKGMPERHAAIVRELVVPIMRKDRFVAILGVGNKPQDYTDQDVQVVSYLADVAWEIAESKRAEEALRESEEQFRNLAERSPNMIYINLKGKIVYANEKCAELTGYSREEFYAPDFDFMTLIAQESRDLVKEQYSKHMQGEDVAPYEYVLITKEGRRLEVINATRLIQYGGERALLGVVTDITERKKAENELQHSYQQMQDMLVTTVNALASTVEMKDQYTAGHQPRGTQLACAIAEEMGLSEEQIEGIRMAGLIHDIGKIMVPAEILNKPGLLTEIQYEMVKMHPQAAFDILKGIKFPWPVAEIVLQHHERMDGSGYPQGLSGDAIMVEARILAVADVVEAMISHRPYRAAHDITEALAEISQNKGILYDPVVVDACLKLFAEKRFEFEQGD
jgi:PAS domain S-box-containing protein